MRSVPLPRVILPVLLASLCAGAPAQAETARQIAQKTLGSVVLLVMEDANGQPFSLGSGFFIRDGIVATNLHVIRGAARGYAKLVGQKRKYDIAGTVGIDSRRDLALLTLRGVKARSLSLGDSRKVLVGDEVYAAGNPQGLEGTFSQGIVSGFREIGSDTLMQITAAISPGSSGGPVLNARGNVIGVAVATFKGGQNLNFAIPSSYLGSLLAHIKPVTPLSTRIRSRRTKSIVDQFGGRSTEGVTGRQLRWTYGTSLGFYSFSLRNQLREPVKDVYCLVVFYDRQGQPIDVDAFTYHEVIPTGLARRVQSRVDGSVQELTTKGREKRPSTKVEIRVLDFKIAR